MGRKPVVRQSSITPTKQPVSSSLPVGSIKLAPTQPPAPHEVIKALERLEKTPLDALKESNRQATQSNALTTKWAYDTGYDDGLGIGFAQGIKYLVSLAEDKLSENFGLPNRDALANSGQIPSWWIATLVKAFDAQAPSITPSAEISFPNPRSKAPKVEPASEED